ncbi:acetyltransferase [Dietzia lutea]|uniref:acetyltransferase n=1 Tax=Dietzia lutea TaxID=546160 RepID=UPI0013306C42
MTRVVIAGAGGFGRGVHSWLISSPRHLAQGGVTDIVFIDDAPPREHLYAEHVGRISDFQPSPDDRILCAIGAPAVRRTVVQLLARRAAKFHTFVADTAVLAHGVYAGEGAIVCPGTVVSADAYIGPHVHINFNCSVGHDTTIGEFSTLSPSVNIMGEVNVGDSVFLGGSCSVLPRIEVGRLSTIAAGATVVESVLSSTTVAGTPARALARGREADDA